MSKRLMSVLIFALIVSAGATFLVYRLISSQMSIRAKPDTAQVILASRNLPVGTLIGELDVKSGEWSGPLPANAVVKKENAIGRGVLATVYSGEPLVESRLAARGAGAGLSATIPPGMRAVAVRVNEVVGVAGFVVPGQRVDVLVLGTPPGNPGNLGMITKTILQNIEVLSAGQDIQKSSEGKPVTVQVVNVLVTPEQAEILSLISTDMRIQLILRNPLDTKESQTTGTNAASIFSGMPVKSPVGRAAPAPVRVAPRPKAATPVMQERVAIPLIVEVIQGTKRSEIKFKDQP
ncbi:MAG: Flp pilus assembly protein CpaB, partial [Acidobacteriales bacterium]